MALKVQEAEDCGSGPGFIRDLRRVWRWLRDSARVPPVRSLWRIVVMWLLVLALPAQALAGARLMHCQPQGNAAPVSVHQQERAAEQAAPEASHCEEQAADTAHRCSACAACNIGTALTPTTVNVPEPAPAAAPQFVPAGTIPSFIASGLERPPRPAST